MGGWRRNGRRSGRPKFKSCYIADTLAKPHTTSLATQHPASPAFAFPS
eukprot:COSAG06_NODE_4026_length_4648_cov_4.871400_1_plen_47_part_10